MKEVVLRPWVPSRQYRGFLPHEVTPQKRQKTIAAQKWSISYCFLCENGGFRWHVSWATPLSFGHEYPPIYADAIYLFRLHVCRHRGNNHLCRCRLWVWIAKNLDAIYLFQMSVVLPANNRQ